MSLQLQVLSIYYFLWFLKKLRLFFNIKLSSIDCFTTHSIGLWNYHCGTTSLYHVASVIIYPTIYMYVIFLNHLKPFEFCVRLWEIRCKEGSKAYMNEGVDLYMITFSRAHGVTISKMHGLLDIRHNRF